MENPLLFTLAVLAVLFTPGPTNTLLATAGAADGMRRAGSLIPAEALGYFIAIMTLRIVLGPLVGSSPLLATGLRLLVGAYLLWISWRLWSRGRERVIGGQQVITPGQVFVTTLLNPKAIIFGLGIIPLGVPHTSLYIAAFQSMAAPVAAIWIAGGAVLGRIAETRGALRLVPRMGAVVIGAFALMLVASPLLR